MNPAEPVVFEGLRLGEDLVDLEVVDGVVARIQESSARDGGLRVLPGLVDLHTHLREPGGEEAETIGSGTAAAARGGYSDLFAMANTDPVTDTVARVEELRRRARDAPARVHPVAAATVGLLGRELVDIDALAAAGVTVFSDDGHCVDDDGLALAVVEAMRRNGTVFAEHAQRAAHVGDGVINERVAALAGAPGWPVRGEEEIVARDIGLAESTGGRVHICHVSTAGTVELLRAAKRRGVPVTAEVTPHHLHLSDEDAVRLGPALKVNPPLRSPEDIAALRAALRDGTIDAVGTDHAPHPAHRKRGDWRTAAFGLTALETALPLVVEVCRADGSAEGPVDWPRVADALAHRPARIGGIAARAGRPVAVGEPATFCVLEPAEVVVAGRAQRSRSANTPFEGHRLHWDVILTVVGGRVTHRNSGRVEVVRGRYTQARA